MSKVTVILPFFNEQGWIGPTVESLAAQGDRHFRLLLVDNGSTDDGAMEAARSGQSLGDRFQIVACNIPGKINAMQAGLALVETPLVAICDADTFYPPDYIERVIAIFEGDPAAAAVMAIDLYAPRPDPASRERVEFIMRKSRRFADKCHAGGYAQAFRTDWLRAAGGFDTGLWPYVLEDHEIVHRVGRFGHSVYHPDHVCYPSERRTSRDSVSWTRWERLLYRYMPSTGMDWYFYRFLAHRLRSRKSLGTALRQKTW
ncbi:glycosyltransferase family 2 protein [Novosphingobium sp. PY1]|uniref:glycosyltransferase family 2 protein n=1 Tax=Novosphingobium sp. PY1 TaxID=1882221 RepID=UPI001A8DB1BA|nr:glycosyltransferase family 2 protein [Novosphingobium sp. PY1]